MYTQSFMAITVPFTFRMKIEDRKSLEELYKLYGSPTPGAFLCEMCNALLSGDQRKAAHFIQRMIQKSGEQLFLKLEAEARAKAEAKPQVEMQPRKRRSKSRRLTVRNRGNAQHRKV